MPVKVRLKISKVRRVLELFVMIIGFLVISWAVFPFKAYFGMPDDEGMMAVGEYAEWTSPDTMRVMRDPGGNVLQRVRYRNWLEKENKEVKVHGFCASACTSYLGLSDVCSAPGALWMFHTSRPVFTPIQSDALNRVAGALMGHVEFVHGLSYPREFRHWLRDMKADMHAEDQFWIIGGDLIDAGWIRPCEDDDEETFTYTRADAQKLSQGYTPPYPMPRKS